MQKPDLDERLKLWRARHRLPLILFGVCLALIYDFSLWKFGDDPGLLRLVVSALVAAPIALALWTAICAVRATLALHR